MTHSSYSLRTGHKAKLPTEGSAVRGRARPRQVPGQMNKTEQRYAGQLDLLKHAGEIIDWRFEPFKLRLAYRTFYTPDFVVILPDGAIRIIEVKAHWEDDARVKIKVAAEVYWWFEFVAVQVVPAADGGGWKEEQFSAEITQDTVERLRRKA